MRNQRVVADMADAGGADDVGCVGTMTVAVAVDADDDDGESAVDAALAVLHTFVSLGSTNGADQRTHDVVVAAAAQLESDTNVAAVAVDVVYPHNVVPLADLCRTRNVTERLDAGLQQQNLQRREDPVAAAAAGVVAVVVASVADDVGCSGATDH